MATSRRGHRWYLDSATAGQRDPRFRGRVDPAGISVARFEETLGRNSFLPILAGKIVPRPDGGSEVVGRVDLPRGVPAVLWVLLLVGGALLLAILGAGEAATVRGSGQAIPFIAIPIAISVFGLFLVRAGLRSFDHAAPKLIGDVADLLEGRPTYDHLNG